MTDSPALPHLKPKHNQWLILIAGFKLFQALLFAALGVGAMKLLHKNVGDVLTQFVEHLRFSPESHFVNFILRNAPLVNDHMLRRIGVVVFIYAGLDLIEGTGLYLEKAWAEFLTLVITGSFLPLELYEVFHRVTVIRVSLLVINALVFLYLLKLVVDKQRHKKASSEVQE